VTWNLVFAHSFLFFNPLALAEWEI